ncbi:UDP-glucosyltransferase 2-like isoform X3 [Anastrepha ludens]|uniref:UDP-glucosyltransferase 2-like isoform X2 n=1 Tax=Anastrepha ludens TaxID=28586 RepID=UPI0023B0C9FA|nr:UDP-glucosyltransferase 2-like isoform X2 [Anastrepha ludens]XP_053963690.1 UDP-glucosyltransferase 2-like isoform X3 [Anastrepha ludens]
MLSKIVFPILALVFLVVQAPSTDGAKILAVYSFPGKSHYMMHRALISELVKHGHQVTMITGLTLEPLKLGSNYTEILIEPEYDYWKDVRDEFGEVSIYEFKNDMSLFMDMLHIIGIACTEHALKQPKVQNIINAKQTEGVYDLLLVEQFYQDAFLALAHVYNIPVISSATFAQNPYMSQMFGIISPFSYVPHSFLPLTEHMTFWARVQNTYHSLYYDLYREFKTFPKMDDLVKKYFGHLPIKFPSVSAMDKNLSAILINNYTPLSSAGPTIDSMINVGGIHIYPPKPLSTDLQKFLDESENGVIYFSLGTQVQSKDMPPEKLQIFLDVFRQLKQRVLWKFENDSIANLPKNVMIKKWMPQNDILAHPNVRVFIAHGGLFGTQEAVYHAVPMLGMPFYCDQYLNLKRAEHGGYAITLDFNTLTRDDLKNGLQQLVYNSTYRDTTKRISRIFHDRPMGPRETALYWIDYVIRHKGARHLRAAGLDLKWYQFYLLDVIAAAVAAVVVALGVAVALVRWILQTIKGRKIKQKVQ